MKIDYVKISNILFERGVRLNSPASPREIMNLANFINCDPSNQFLETFNYFNGFSEGSFDIKTSISFWHIDKIIENTDPKHLPFVKFADYSFYTDIYELEVSDEVRPICTVYGREVVAESYDAFWKILVSSPSYL